MHCGYCFRAIGPHLWLSKINVLNSYADSIIRISSRRSGRSIFRPLPLPRALRPFFQGSIAPQLQQGLSLYDSTLDVTALSFLTAAAAARDRPWWGEQIIPGRWILSIRQSARDNTPCDDNTHPTRSR